MTILAFPDLATLRLALSSAIIPPDIAASPLEFALEGEKTIVVRTPARLAKAALADLKKLGVDPRKSADLDFEKLTCWPQALPVEADRSGAVPPSNLPVFFEVAEGQAGELIGEMLRLGVDRQSLRWLATDGRPSALVRVVGPPYFSLLRAIDRADGPVAYVEQVPRVLVEIGHRHPMADKFEIPPGRVAMIRPLRAWRVVEDGPFRDVYGSLSFPIAAPRVDLQAVEVSANYQVPLRLARGSTSEPAELWVLRDRAEEQVEELVRSGDERLLARLAFAVAEGDPRVVVIRARPSKLPPPALVLDGLGFRPYLRLPNLFLPVGTRLHPPLRRDSVAKLLASDPALVTWLVPVGAGLGGFVPEGLPDSAFRPLDRWVDYVLDREHEPLTAWVESTRFDFGRFACDDDERPEPPRPRNRRDGKRGDPSKTGPSEPAGPSAPRPPKASRPNRPAQAAAPLPSLDPNLAAIRLGELEARYRTLDAPPESAERRDLLIEMAGLNADLDRPSDASACYAMAFWEGDVPPSDALDAWAAREAPGRPGRSKSFEAILDVDSPTSADLRAFAVALMHRAFGAGTGPGDLGPLDRVQHFLERQEASLPARMGWLAWLAFAQLAEGDVLALARARDRLLERLHRGGLRPELDLPGFLRFGIGATAERSGMIRDRMIEFHEQALAWVERGSMIAPETRALADLIFAFGLARLGDRDLASQVLSVARQPTKARDSVMSLLTRAFEHRINQALAGQPIAGPLPSDLLERLEQMGQAGGRDKEDRYKVDRLRKNSRILEPHERINPYRHWKGSAVEGLSKELAEWPDVADRDALAHRVRTALATKHAGPNAATVRFAVVREALEVAFRLGDENVEMILAKVLPVADESNDLLRQAELLEKGLRVAGHFDRPDDVRAFVARFDGLLTSGGSGAASALEPVLGQCFRGLRRLGLRDGIERLLGRIGETILSGREFAPGPRTGIPAIDWSSTLKLLLQVAAVRFDLGEPDLAWPVLDEARALLFEGELIPVHQTGLACAYLRSMALAPVERALPRVGELFAKLERVHDSFTTTSHYSLSRLDVVEAAVTTLVSEDFALDRTGRGLLEDDEFLVRRRVHRDVRAALGAAG